MPKSTDYQILKTLLLAGNNGYNRSENTVEINLDNPVDVAMTVELTGTNNTCVKFNFDSKPTDSSCGLSLSRSVSVVQ